MEKIRRRVIEIDREKCNGCGKCATACHEGAIQIVGGKAELVGDIYCDGLGDCIGDCPVNAIRFLVREAEPYDEAAVRARLSARTAGGCPGCAGRGPATAPATDDGPVAPGASRLANWPLQIRLVPENAPFLAGAELVLAADCVAFAAPDFQRRFLGDGGKACLIGCPKLDDAEFYVEKLAGIIRANRPTSIRVVRMEVPCCGGMTRIAREAAKLAGADISVDVSIVTVDGRVIE